MIRLNANLFLYQLIAFVPYALGLRYPLLRKINQIAFKLQTKISIKRLGLTEYCIYVFRPEQEFILDLFPNKIKCYEVHDEYSLYPNMPQKKSIRLDKSEKDLLNKIDIVFAFSESIYERKKQINSNTHFIRNAIKYEDFSKALEDNAVIPDDLRKIKPPRIGYAGRINERIDIELMNYLTCTFHDWSFIMLGEIDGKKKFTKSSDFIELMNKPNMHFLGWKDHSVLQYYYKYFDVCIIPWVVNEYGNALNPQKQYQYSAVGKPVVSTYIRDVRPFSNIINLARDKLDFGNLIENCLNDKDPIKIKERIRFAKENSVIVRAKEKLEIVENLKEKVNGKFHIRAKNKENSR